MLIMQLIPTVLTLDFSASSSATSSSILSILPVPVLLLLFLLLLLFFCFFFLLLIGNQLENPPDYPTPRKFFFLSLLYSHVKMISKFRLSYLQSNSSYNSFSVYVKHCSVGLIKIKKGKV